ncbi:MAG: TIGR03790 family protein [Terriglobales bacterium]
MLRATIVPIGNQRASAFLLLVMVLPLHLTAASEPPLHERVLVVYNAKAKHSEKVADAYLTARGIPRNHKCALRLTWHETHYGPYDGTVAVPVGDWERKVRNPVRKCLQAVGRDRILYIVLTYGTPYKFSNIPLRHGVSIDQRLADIWEEAPGDARRASNPYFAHSLSASGQYAPFVSLADYRSRPDAKTIYSVWRLDAPSPALALGLIQKAAEAEKKGPSGQACFDRRMGAIKDVRDARYGAGDWDIYRAAQMVRDAGIPVLEDSHEKEFGTSPAPARCDNAILYTGWYSLDYYNDAFSWNPGAIGIHLDSASAADPRGGSNWSANAVKKGITVTAGAITEPDLFGLPHPDGVFRNLLEGANVGDAFLRNTLWLRWMILNIGDPLYRPFPGGRLGKPPSPEAPK